MRTRSSSKKSALPPVLILGTGINGAAVARELALHGLGVWIVDRRDIASGATAYSSRLIHGGLRYLEHGEFDLVRESLEERTRLLRLAPHLVRPLRLFIPVQNRLGGVTGSLRRFLSRGRTQAAAQEAASRGLWLIRAGLWLYDYFAGDPVLPDPEVFAVGARGAPAVDRRKYRWLCAYYDAQVAYPERFTLDLLEDARRVAAAAGTEFRLWTYHEAQLAGRAAVVRSAGGSKEIARSDVSAVVNATGAWVDRTLETLHIPAPRLMGGTQGSHLITFHTGLRSLLGGEGIYCGAADGRPVFLLPWGAGTLVGTTDIPYQGDPADAVASDAEIDYLLAAVNYVFPQAGLARGDVAAHYSGVRPLPHTDDRDTAGITRRHWAHWHKEAAVPFCSLVGGKLTTCRSLAEDTATALLERLDRPAEPVSRDRPLPGAEGYPGDDAALAAAWRDLASRHRLDEAQVTRLWGLLGTRLDAALAEAGSSGGTLDGTQIPLDLARWMIEHEWATTLADLVERRLVLLAEPRLTAPALRQLANLLVNAGRLASSDVDAAVDQCQRRLVQRHGRRVDSQSDS
jgi:glycerol-3-phosphate dehydrogenase